MAYERAEPFTARLICSILPGAEAVTSAAGDEPNQREMKLRFWRAEAPDEVED